MPGRTSLPVALALLLSCDEPERCPGLAAAVQTRYSTPGPAPVIRWVDSACIPAGGRCLAGYTTSCEGSTLTWGGSCAAAWPLVAHELMHVHLCRVEGWLDPLHTHTTAWATARMVGESP